VKIVGNISGRMNHNLKVALILCMAAAATEQTCGPEGSISHMGYTYYFGKYLDGLVEIFDKDFIEYSVVYNNCFPQKPYCDSEGKCQRLGRYPDDCGDGAAPCGPGYSCLAGTCIRKNDIVSCKRDRNVCRGDIPVCTSDTKACVPNKNNCLSDKDCLPNHPGTTCKRIPGPYNWTCQ